MLTAVTWLTLYVFFDIIFNAEKPVDQQCVFLAIALAELPNKFIALGRLESRSDVPDVIPKADPV